MKKMINIILAMFALFSCTLVVNAKDDASALISFNGPSTVQVDSNIEITLHISDIVGANKGVSAYGAELIYNDEFLEFISYESKAPFDIDYEDSSRRLGGFAFNKNKFITTSSSDLITFVFKAKKIGNTDISISQSEVSDGVSNIIPSNNPSKLITILSK